MCFLRDVAFTLPEGGRGLLLAAVVEAKEGDAWAQVLLILRI